METNNNEKNVKQQIFGMDYDAFAANVIRGLKRLGWLVIVLAIVFSLLNLIRVKLSYRPQYKAEATLAVTANEDSEYMYQERQNNYAASQVAATFDYVIKLDAFERIIMDDLQIDSIPSNISAVSIKDTNMVILSVTANDYSLATDLLHSIINNYPTIGAYMMGSLKLEVLDEIAPNVPANVYSKREVLIKGAIIGAAVGLAFIVAMALMRRTVRNRRDIDGAVNISFIGKIPKGKFKKRSKTFDKSVLITNKKISPEYINAVRTTRIRLERRLKEKDYKTLLVTSAIPNEGKTTFAVNFALSLAQSEKKVVLIDADFRNPSVLKTIGAKDKKSAGVLDVITGKVKLEDAVFYDDALGINILAGNEASADPIKYIKNDRWEDMLDQLKEIADVVIIDTSPCSITTETSILAQNIDAGILVIRQDFSHISRIIESTELLQTTPLELIGCVINMAEDNK